MGEPTTVGIVANPASARDIRRIVASGGAVTTYDKVNRLDRLMSGLAATGVARVVSMADRAGIATGLLRLSKRRSAAAWPKLEIVDHEISGSELDSREATKVMVKVGASAIVVLGGDGTNRVVSTVSNDVPLVSLSTGTNNAFPRPAEPTVAGMAAGLVAGDDRCREAGTYRAKKLIAECRDQVEEALVDVAVLDVDRVGAGAVWDINSISELYLAFAEADAIGLSAIGGHLQPTSRRAPVGLTVALGQPVAGSVVAPIGPGLISTVAVRAVNNMSLDTAYRPALRSGVIALDGERRIRVHESDQPTITLRATGPVVVDVAATLDFAAQSGLLAAQPGGPKTFRSEN